MHVGLRFSGDLPSLPASLLACDLQAASASQVCSVGTQQGQPALGQADFAGDYGTSGV
jgi:hypothetical protein